MVFAILAVTPWNDPTIPLWIEVLIIMIVFGGVLLVRSKER